MTDPHWRGSRDNPWGHPVWNRLFRLQINRNAERDQVIDAFLERHPEIGEHELIENLIAPLSHLETEWFAIAAELPPPKWELVRDPNEWEDWNEGPIDTSLE